MKITELSVQKKNPNRFNLFVDDIFLFSVSTTAIASYHLYKDKEVTEELLEEIYNEELYRRFLDRAAQYLSKYVKSEKDTRKYLNDLWRKKKGSWFSEDLQLDWESLYDRVIEQLIKYGFVDDVRFARLFIESRMKGKPRSTSILLSELITKGISREIALEAIKESGAENSSLILTVYRKKFKGELLDLRDKKKVDFLRRKGFNWDDISKLVNDLKNDA